VRGGNLATAEGVSYLEAKHLLLLHYCINIVFYLLLKAEGRPVRDHPVIARLLELRAYLEKIRPIDKKLQYQMDKLLMAAQLQVSQLGSVEQTHSPGNTWLLCVRFGHNLIAAMHSLSVFLACPSPSYSCTLYDTKPSLAHMLLCVWMDEPAS